MQSLQTYIHVTKYETKYGRLVQSIMHEPSQANYANKQEINTLINVTVQHTVQKVFPHITRLQVG